MDDATVKLLHDELLDELKGAIKYADLATKIHDDSYATYFAQMAEQEMGHYEAIVEILQDAGKYKPTDILAQTKVKADQALEAL